MEIKESEKFRNFVFTWNNWTRDFDMSREILDWLEDTAGPKLKIQYAIVGEEIGEEKTCHLQGYVELVDRKSFKSIKSMFNRCYIDRRRGTQSQAIEYCKKQGNYHEYGTRKTPGSRTDLQDIKRLLHNNNSIKALLEECDNLSYQGLRTAERLVRYTDNPRDYKPMVLWFCGPTNTGKTRKARELLPNAYFKTNCSHIWWPFYDSEEDIIIDDLRAYTYPFIKLLGLLDRYPYQVEDKGVVRQFRGRRIIITAPYTPDIFYRDSPEELKQLYRRITKLYMFNNENPEVRESITPDLWSSLVSPDGEIVMEVPYYG